MRKGWIYMKNIDFIKAQSVVKALNKNEFDASFIETKEEAINKIMDLIPDKSKVGIGGSMTIKELKLEMYIASKNCDIYNILQKGLSQVEMLRVREEQLKSDVFLTSSNAITKKGELVNIDNSGNRVTAMTFGPSRIIVVAGINKITTNLDTAIDRVKNHAAPKISSYFGFKTPCAETGFCNNCTAPITICRTVSIIRAKPRAVKNYNVIIIGEHLGY